MEDQPADPGDLTTGEAAATPRRRRRWFSLRRRPEESASEPDSAVAEETEDVARDEAKPAPRPVGKANRRARTQVSEPEAAEQPDAESEVDEPQAEPAQPDAESDVDEPQPDAEPDVESAAGEPQAEAADESDTAESDAEPQEVRFVPHRPAGRRLIAAAVAAAVLFVGAAAFAGATLQPYLAERAEVNTKLEVASTAARAISTLWTYTPDNMETLPDRAAAFLGGDFAYEYRKYIDAIVATNKQAKVTNTTQVLGAAVETLTPTEATAIVYTNSVATSPMTKNIPSLRYLSYRLTMERRDAKWLITRMSTITSLDLTPQL